MMKHWDIENMFTSTYLFWWLIIFHLKWKFVFLFLKLNSIASGISFQNPGGLDLINCKFFLLAIQRNLFFLWHKHLKRSINRGGLNFNYLLHINHYEDYRPVGKSDFSNLFRPLKSLRWTKALKKLRI